MADTTAPTITTVAPSPLPTAASTRGAASTNTSLPTGISVPDIGFIVAVSTIPVGQTREEQQHAGGDPPHRPAKEEEHRPQREPRHAQDAAAEVEDPVGPLVPAGRHADRERSRGRREEDEGHGPGPLVWPAPLARPFGGREGEHRRQSGRRGGEREHHDSGGYRGPPVPWAP